MEIRSSSGPLNEHLPESRCCATPDGRGNENICPEDEVKSPVVVSKRSRKEGRLTLRKSLAWNPAFFTEEGVLDSTELSKITDSVAEPSSKLVSKANVDASSIKHFDKFSRRPPLINLEEFFLRKVHSRSMSSSNNKMVANLFSISEASKHDGPHMPMTLRKTPTRNMQKLDTACLMEKVKTAKPQVEKHTTTLKLDSCPSSSNRSKREMSCSAPAGLVKEKGQNFRGLLPPTIQAKQSTLRMPSSNGRLEKEKTAKPLVEKAPILLKLNSCPSLLTKSPMDTTCSCSVGIFSPISQQTFSIPGLPLTPVQAKPSALRMPSPSLGFFQQKIVTSSDRDQLHRIFQVPMSSTPSQRKLANLKRMAFSKPPVTQVEQQSKKAHTDMETKRFGKKGIISSSVCGRSNCISNVANEITINCLSVNHNMHEKTQEVLLGKFHTGRTTERVLTDEHCSKSQISCKPLTEGNGLIEKFPHFNGFESTSCSSQYSDGYTATETSRTSSEMHLTQNLDESNLKPLHIHIPVMNGELVMLKDAGDQTNADTRWEKLQCISPSCGASEQSSLYIERRKDPTEERSVQNNEEYFNKTRSQVQQTTSGKPQTGEVHANSSQDVQLTASEECQPQDDLQLCEPRNEINSVDENGLMPTKKISLDNLKQDTVFLKHHLSVVPYSEEWLAAIEAFGEEILEVKTGTVHNSPPDKDIPESGPWSPPQLCIAPLCETRSSEISFFSDKSAKVFVAGHRGLVGSAVLRRLVSLGFTNLLVRSRAELDLTRESEVESLFAIELPRYVILCVAKVKRKAQDIGPFDCTKYSTKPFSWEE